MKLPEPSLVDGAVVSLPMRGEWIEMSRLSKMPSISASLPMRGEWIEMLSLVDGGRRRRVSPHAGRVD